MSKLLEGPKSSKIAPLGAIYPPHRYVHEGRRLVRQRVGLFPEVPRPHRAHVQGGQRLIPH